MGLSNMSTACPHTKSTAPCSAPGEQRPHRARVSKGIDSAGAACLQGANCIACLAAGIQTGGVLRPARTYQGQDSLSRWKPKHLFQGPPQLNKNLSNKLAFVQTPLHQNQFRQPLLVRTAVWRLCSCHVPCCLVVSLLLLRRSQLLKYHLLHHL